MPGPQSIDGLISNLSTTKIVDAMISAERKTMVEPLTNRQTDATSKLTTYNSISALLVGLQAGLTPLLRASVFDAATLNVSDDKMLNASAVGRVTPGTYSLSVASLATNHQIASQGYDDPVAGVLGTGTIQIAVGKASARTLTIDTTNNSLTGLKNAINAARIGVTAGIIGDGSSSKPYRLLLSADATGKDNTIAVTVNLTGGAAPDFANSSFDQVEKLAGYAGTSAVALGSTAFYTGSQNKTYTFTVAGSGAQTIGGAPITINWTDGTNTGSFNVTTAGTEIALTGTGSDGLKLTFGAGTLVGGDRFQVQTFAPLLQKADDARVSLGSTAAGASPITISSASNQIKDLISGVTLNLKAITTTPVTITADADRTAIKTKITEMLDRYNAVMKAIDKQFTYNSDTKAAGALLGDQFLLALQSQLRAQLGGVVDGLPKGLNMLRSIGIRTAADGTVMLVDPGALADKLASDLNAVRNLFVDSGSSTNSLITFLSAGAKTVESTSGYEVRITQAATRPTLRGAAITSPATTPLVLTGSNNTIRVVVDGARSDALVLSAGTYSSGQQLAAEIQAKVNADSAIGSRGVTVAWVDNGDSGYLEFTSGSYGSGARLTIEAADSNSALSALGFGSGGTFAVGEDVAGTINGEAATGAGQVLTGNARNPKTQDLRLEVRLTPQQLTGGVDALVTFSRGFASRLDRTVDAMSRAVDGSISRRTSGIQAEVDDLKKQIADKEARLAQRREKLFEQFTAMERALSEFQTQGQFLSQQLGQISANFQTMLSQRS